MRLVGCEPRLRDAAHDMRFLMGRGYTRKVSLRVVSNRYGLSKREQMVLFRGVYDDKTAGEHREKRVSEGELRGKVLGVDWYNVFITVEGGLMGEPLVLGDDGFLRDVRGLHGRHHARKESLEAVEDIIRFLKGLELKSVSLYLDADVSRSGEARALIEETMGIHGLSGIAVTTKSPDRDVVSNEVSASSDAIVIEKASAAFDIPSSIFSRNEKIMAIALK